MSATHGGQAAVAPSNGAAVSEAIPHLRDTLGASREAALEMLQAEQALSGLRQRFENSDDPAARGELAAQALDQVEEQLKLTRERRRHLDGVEGQLWARRNRLERFLIHTRGTAWWQARRKLPRQVTG